MADQDKSDEVRGEKLLADGLDWFFKKLGDAIYDATKKVQANGKEAIETTGEETPSDSASKAHDATAPRGP